MSTGLRPDPWLSTVLGFAAFTTDDPTAVPDDGARSLTFAKIAASDTTSLSQLQAAGFRVVDVNVTLELDGDAGDGEPGNVQAATGDQHEALIDVAGRSFRYSRFHLDPLLPDDLADRVKREWIRSYTEGRRGLELLAATEDGQPIGFLAVLEAPGARVIDLVAVAPEAQGHGHGRGLVAAFAERHRADGRRLLVGTQIANVPSLRLYESLGFRVVDAKYVLHLHRGL